MHWADLQVIARLIHTPRFLSFCPAPIILFLPLLGYVIWYSPINWSTGDVSVTASSAGIILDLYYWFWFYQLPPLLMLNVSHPHSGYASRAFCLAEDWIQKMLPGLEGSRHQAFQLSLNLKSFHKTRGNKFVFIWLCYTWHINTLIHMCQFVVFYPLSWYLVWYPGGSADLGYYWLLLLGYYSVEIWSSTCMFLYDVANIFSACI